MQQLYRHFNSKDELMYIGISLSTVARLSQHKEHSHWFSDITKVTIEKYETREEVLLAEKQAIQTEKPLYNIKHNKPKKEKKLSSFEEAEISRKRLTNNIVNFQPVYSVQHVANILYISTNKVKTLMDKGLLGNFESKKSWSDRWGKYMITRCVTGWQMIDFIENLEKGIVNLTDL